MVHKIRLFIFIFVFLFLFVLLFFHSSSIETNLLKTLLPSESENSSKITAVADRSSSVIKIVFESTGEETLEKTYNDFFNKIDSDYFVHTEINPQKLVNQYLSHPGNFLSPETKKLLREKKFDEVFSKSLQALYNPGGIQLSQTDKDPYMLSDDFILAVCKNNNKILYENRKYYKADTIQIKNSEALSPDIGNKKIEKLIKLKEQLSDDKTKIYLANTPIHSYYTSKKAVISINIICILSIIMIIFMIVRLFGNIKPLFPVILSISFGMLSGYVATLYLFSGFQTVTALFSASIIGIGIDYSFHYFFSEKIDKAFIKNLTFGFLTTVVSFVLLYFTGIELLKQIAVFTVFGLSGIYLVVIFIYPCFNKPVPVRKVKFHPHIYSVCLAVLIVIGLFGFMKLKFDYSLSSLYTPSKTLQQSEILYNKVSGNNNEKTGIILVHANNINKIIETEEKVIRGYFGSAVNYSALSTLIPSEKTQEENFNLVKELYNNTLSGYSEILSPKQINNLKNSKFYPVDFKINDYPFLKNFMLNPETSMIFVFSDKKPDISDPNVSYINITSNTEKYLKQYSHKLLCVFPVVIFVLIVLLSFLYDFKRAIILLIPPIAGVIISVLINSLIYGGINLFGIITTFLILGFTADYSIFGISAKEETKSAVAISCLTTSFSFFLLSFCGFKMLASMSLMLFFGIITAYMIGYLLFNRSKKNS